MGSGRISREERHGDRRERRHHIDEANVARIRLCSRLGRARFRQHKRQKIVWIVIRHDLQRRHRRLAALALNCSGRIDLPDARFVACLAFACYFDVGNALLTGYPEHWIATLGPRIRRVHFKDFRRNVATIDGFCDLLSGDVNWPAVMHALREIRYEGWIAAEMIPPVPFYKHSPETLIHNTSRAMDAIFALGGNV